MNKPMTLAEVEEELDSVDFLLMDDSDTVCYLCARENMHNIKASIADNDHDGWLPMGVVILADGERETCCVCGDETGG